MRYRPQCRSFPAAGGQFPLALWVLVALGFGAMAQSSMAVQAGADGGDSNLERFKQFISSPPPMTEMTAEVCRPKGTDQGLTCSYVLVRWQTNGFLYREAPTLGGLFSTNLYSGLRLSGCYDEDYWNFSPDGHTLEWFTNRNEALQATLNYVKMAASSIMHLGIFDALPGAIQWNDDSLVRFTNGLGVAVNGSVIVGADGLPAGLRLITERNGRAVPWEITYTFAHNRSMPPFVPAVISASACGSGKPEFVEEVSIKSIETSVQLLPRAAYMPGTFRQKGQIVVSAPLPTPKYERATSRSARGIVIVCLVLTSIIFPSILAARMKNRRRPPGGWKQRK
jgi:hypothetical protein